MLRWFFELFASAQGEKRLFLRAVWELIRRILMLFGDPSYNAVIHGKEMRLPISHKLPIYVANCRYYDELPSRVSTYLRDQEGRLTMIDVGANVGDTILFCYEDQRDKFLALEVNPLFVKYLKRNCASIRNFELVETLCSSEDHNAVTIKIAVAHGTASAVKSQKGLTLQATKLDTIVAERPQFRQTNFLKIDTDGSDFDVIRGAHKTIGMSKPMVLMECDVFANKNYVSDFSETMKFFLHTGYETMIAYDNLGYLFGVFAVRDYMAFKYALFHQLISRRGYFDLLFLSRAHRQFTDRELAYFESTIPDDNIRIAVNGALHL